MDIARGNKKPANLAGFAGHKMLVLGVLLVLF